ncbi:uncharacterized protein LOC132066523 [Lycium ferocissimum]|uniref:uncharacterized protein LOC132066523 n=1 Tax=Lycium ferocissimum TaxID=112874 RepID=UPI002815E5E9|nr:uncharacterized protein LOC132066523 [Lycium ferocissimum]
MRLKQVFPSLVSDAHAAFVSGRSLIHNVLICHDLMKRYNRKSTPKCLMKIDLRKAYDMLQWDFLEEMLHGYGFPEKFVQLVMLCVATTKFSIKVNGSSYRYFEDDLMIFCKANEASVKRVMEAQEHFTATTGLIANIDKSSMFTAGVDDEMKSKLLSITGFESGTFPIRYLGLPLSRKKWNNLECHQLCLKIAERIRAAAHRHFSYAGRLQIIQFVLFSVHNFWGGVFILPQSVVKEVDKVCRDFLWGNSEEKRKIHLVAWEKLCRPKGQGGLNIKCCKVWNMASMGKLIWWLMERPNILWVKWIHGIYMNNGDDFKTHTPSSDCSWYWKRLHKIKHKMITWYSNGRYCLTILGKYSVVRG